MATATVQKPANSVGKATEENPKPVVQNGTAHVQPDPVKRKPRANIAPDDETPGARWIRLANFRVPRVKKVLASLANLANRQNYEYTHEQATILVSVLEDEVKMIKARFFQGQPAAIDKPLF